MTSAQGPADDDRLPPAVDVTVLAALLLDIGDESLEMRRTLWTSYLQDGEPQVAQLWSAAVAGDAVTVRQAAHGLKSSSAALGALRLAGLLQQAEDAARAGSPGLADLAQSVTTEYRRVAAEVETLCAAPG